MAGLTLRNEAALVALLKYERMKPSDIHAELLRGNTPEAVIDDRSGALIELEDSPLLQARRDIESWREQGIDVLTPYTESYPAQLRGVYNFPLVLFGRGLVLDDWNAASIVGSRAASPDEIAKAGDIAFRLAREGVSIVSGLAAGIDTAAHTAALSAGGRTVGVLGTGVDRVYPRQNARLHEVIAESGLLLSQFWPGSSPTKQSFPMRNVTMSSYSGVTIIVAAGENSGTKHQATAAARQGKMLLVSDEVASRTTWGQTLVHQKQAVAFKTAADAVELTHDLLQPMGTATLAWA